MADVYCPTCEKKMKKKKHGKYECTIPSCGDKYIAIPKSIFGVD